MKEVEITWNCFHMVILPTQTQHEWWDSPAVNGNIQMTVGAVGSPCGKWKHLGDEVLNLDTNNLYCANLLFNL